MTEIIVGTRVTIPSLGTFQNFQINSARFAPFAFSGAIHNATGDNLPATLAFPVNEITITVLNDLIRDAAVVRVEEVVDGRTEFVYNGQVVGGQMSETEAVLQLTNFLDAITAEFPWKFLTEDLVGPLPTLSNVSVR